MNKTGLLLIVFSGILIFSGFSLPDFPAEEPVFTDTVIPRIYILIDPDSLEAIFNDVTSSHEFPVTFIFQSGSISDTIESVGFRLRGNTFGYSPKKSFKISFNTFNPGGNLYKCLWSADLVHFNKLISSRLYDLSGRLLMEKANVSQLNTEGILSGICLLRSEKGGIVKIIIQ